MAGGADADGVPEARAGWRRGRRGACRPRPPARPARRPPRGRRSTCSRRPGRPAPAARARVTVGSNMANCSSRLRLRLRWAKVSVALPKIAMWRQPSSSARSRPRSLGTSTGRSLPVSPPLRDESSARRRRPAAGPMRVHEAGGLDDRQPGREQPADELGLGLHRDDALLVLQAVARDRPRRCDAVTALRQRRRTLGA